MPETVVPFFLGQREPRRLIDAPGRSAASPRFFDMPDSEVSIRDADAGLLQRLERLKTVSFSTAYR
jgi:hypothetical protein